MQRYTVYLYLKTALHVSGGNTTHHQKSIQMYLQHPLFVTPLLISVSQTRDTYRVFGTEDNYRLFGNKDNLHTVWKTRDSFKDFVIE
jgi:hypothetical protein